MAREARLTAQLPTFKCTPTQREIAQADAEARKVSLGDIQREAMDAKYGLVNGERPAAQGAPVG